MSKELIGRYGYVLLSDGIKKCGHVIDVDGTGQYVLWHRTPKFKDKWYPINVVHLYEQQPHEKNGNQA